MENYSLDTLFNENLKIKQSKTGYRYSIDPVLVSCFAKPLSGSKIIDLGTGCGIIPLVLTHRISGLEITGIEVQENLAELAKENIVNNRLQNNVTIVLSDIKDFAESFVSETIDMVITNPPYTKKNAGRINFDTERAIARHEIKITLEELLKVAAALIKDKGEFVIVYPEKRLEELLTLMKNNGIHPHRLRMVHPKKNSRPKLVLVSGIKNSKPDFIIEPPLYIYDESELYSEEMQRMFQ